MRAGFGQFNQATPEYLRFAQQYGVTDILLNTPQLPTAGGQWQLADLVKLRLSVEQHGMKLSALENVPSNFYDHIMLGGPKRDEQIENWCKSLTNMGKAGIPVLGYHFMVLYVWRTSSTTPGRGQARVTSFDYELVKDAPITELGEISDEQMWDNFTYFLKAVIPVAERAGVRMGLHPDDPPISPLAGVARIFRSHSALRRLIETVPSEYNGLEFCQGTISEMPENVIHAIRYFGSRGKIFYVHFRNIKGSLNNFVEVFPDEGDIDMLKALRVYKEVGYEYMIMPVIADPIGEEER